MPDAKKSDRPPLCGRRILVTRATGQASPLADQLREQGAEPVFCPTISIVPPASYSELDTEIARLTETDFLVLTSTNAVEAFFARLAAAGRDARALAGVKLVVVGPKTAEALANFGVHADLMPANYEAEGVVALLCKQVTGKRVLYPRAALARDLIAKELTAAGATVTAPVAYASAPPADAALVAGTALVEGLDLLTFTAASTVRNFAGLLNAEQLAQARTVPAAVIGPQTAAAARELGFTVTVEPAEATLEAMVAAVIEYFKETGSEQREDP